MGNAVVGFVPVNKNTMWQYATSTVDGETAYAACHDAVEAYDRQVSPTFDWFKIGQSLVKHSNLWTATIFRTALWYNTGAFIAAATPILSVQLKLDLGKVSTSCGGWHIYIKMGSDINDMPSRSALTNYPLYLSKGTVYAVKSEADLVTDDVEEYTFDLTWTASLLKNGYIGIILITDRDAAREIPTKEDWGDISECNDWAWMFHAVFDQASLLVEITLSVTTDAATNVEPFTATLNGTLTQSDGDGLWDCYFQWGESSPYNETTKLGKSNGQKIYANVSGLNPGTTYRFRAVAEQSGKETLYGSWRSFNSGGGAYPSAEAALARVSSLVHRWVPGSYTLEMVLGGLTSEYSLMVPSGKPTPTIPPKVPEIPTCPPGYMLSWTLARGYHCVPAPGFPEPGLLT